MTSIEWIAGKVRFIDQTRLPLTESYVETAEVREIGDAIRQLRIRGAPAIGVAAAFGLLLAVNEPSVTGPPELKRRFLEAREFLAKTRPTAVNLFAALERMQRALDRSPGDDMVAMRRALTEEAFAIRAEDVDACRKIGEFGAALLPNGASVLTHCNTGALATAGAGTALSIIVTAAKLGKITKVFVDETRPLLQGARLTAWELLREGIDATLITDSTAGKVLAEGKVKAVIVGADRIAANGDTANKIGTYPLAILARHHGVSFYVAAPVTTIDVATATGRGIRIEERDGREVTQISGVRVAPEGIGVYAPAFDVTPNEFIDAIVTNYGVLRPPYDVSIADLCRRISRSEKAP